LVSNEGDAPSLTPVDGAQQGPARANGGADPGDTKPKRKKPPKDLDAYYVEHRREVGRSPSWIAASIHCRRLLDALEDDLCTHRLRNNGGLHATYTQLAKRGLKADYVLKAIVEAETLGLARRTHQGGKSAAHDDMNGFWLCYAKHYRLANDGVTGIETPPSDEWKGRFKDVAEAKLAVRRALGKLKEGPLSDQNGDHPC
jgi:hypothetical protein